MFHPNYTNMDTQKHKRLSSLEDSICQIEQKITLIKMRMEQIESENRKEVVGQLQEWYNQQEAFLLKLKDDFHRLLDKVW